MKLNKLFIVAVSLSTSLLYGASFDCDKASSKVEHLICGDDELSILDEHLFIAYRDAKKYEDPKRLKSEQREWLRHRDFCTTIECLQQSYVERLKILEGYAKGEEPTPWTGTFELDHGDNKLVIDSSKKFHYSNIGAKGLGCEIEGTFTAVGDDLEFHDSNHNCKLKVTVVTQNMLHLEGTPCQAYYCGQTSAVESGTYKRIAK